MGDCEKEGTLQTRPYYVSNVLVSFFLVANRKGMRQSGRMGGGDKREGKIGCYRVGGMKAGRSGGNEIRKEEGKQSWKKDGREIERVKSK